MFSKFTVMTCISEEIKTGEENKPYMLLGKGEMLLKYMLRPELVPSKKLWLLCVTRCCQSNNTLCNPDRYIASGQLSTSI